MSEQQKSRRKKLLWLIPLALILLFCGAFFIYTGDFYRANDEALARLQSGEAVTVTKTDYGYFFDGPSETDALIFYPGAKVEETAYAPLMHELAASGMDVCLVKMPFHIAFFGMNDATAIMDSFESSTENHYTHWYIGGHSLGGAVAAIYAAKNAETVSGLVLLAAYPTKSLDESLNVVSIYGSEDGVLNMEKLEEGEQYMPSQSKTVEIEGGNHAQFGNYGFQRGDGEAAISAENQQEETVRLILEWLNIGSDGGRIK